MKKEKKLDFLVMTLKCDVRLKDEPSAEKFWDAFVKLRDKHAVENRYRTKVHYRYFYKKP